MIELEINGARWQDHTEASVTWSLEALARGFSFSFSDKWFLSTSQELPFREGDPCKVYVDGTEVISGFLDTVAPSYDERSHSITLSGRCNNGHLVDCSAIHKSGKWKEALLKKIAEDVASPFGIGVTVDPSAPAEVSSTPFKRWAIEEEETAAGVITRAAKMRGVFPTSDGGSNVVLTGASSEKSSGALEYGVNIKNCQRTGKWSERFSTYIVKSQTAGYNDWFGEDAASKGSVSVDDEDVTTYRPLVIVSDGQGYKSELEARAKWERNVRAGRSQRLRYTVVGYSTDAGDLWTPNTLVRVKDPLMDVDTELLIISVKFEAHARSPGYITTIEVGAPAGLDVFIPPPRRQRKKWLSRG